MTAGIWEIGPAMALAQLQATATRSDLGTGNARVRIYLDVPADFLGSRGAQQAEVVLAKPSATVVNGTLVLHVRDAAGAMVMATGIPRWADWHAADGALLAGGEVSDADHAGPWRLFGGTTPEGETSPLLYAGSLVQLGETSLT